MDIPPVAFVFALLPVLLIGVALVELLLADAPRRGKRPDVGRERLRRAATPPVCVVTRDGQLLMGRPQTIALRLGAPAVTAAAARRRLDDLEAAGQIRRRLEATRVSPTISRRER